MPRPYNKKQAFLNYYEWDAIAIFAMRDLKGRPQRRSSRLPDYDYSQSGAYFVTVCVFQKECLFGEIEGDKIVLTEIGQIIKTCWINIPKHYNQIFLDKFIVMPNHIHGIVLINNVFPVGARHASPAICDKTNTIAGEACLTPTLGNLIGSFKSASTKQINQNRNTPSIPVWQRNYHDRIIRDESEMDRIREYIINNPLQWALDEENPMNILV